MWRCLSNARLQYRLIVVPGMCASKVDLSSRLGVCVASKYLPRYLQWLVHLVVNG